MYTNADQLVNKRDELCMAIAGDEPHIILITESIPKAQVLPIDAVLLDIPGYVLFPSFDLSEKNLGKSGIRGICVYVRDGVRASQVHIQTQQLVEHLWIEIKLRSSDKLLIGCVYRSPSANPHQSVDELAQLLHAVQNSKPSHLLIAGDFNLPQIDWASSFCNAADSHYAQTFLHAVQDCLLFQHITCPTRYREGDIPNPLDLVLTNEEGMLSNLQYLPGLGKSDHVVLRFQLACYTDQVVLGLERPNFHRANFSELDKKLSEVNWNQGLSGSVEEGYRYFKLTIDYLIRAHVPMVRSPLMRKNVYMTSRALQLRKRKNMLWQRCVASGDPLDKARFRLCRNQLRQLTRQLRMDFETQLVSDIKANPRAFWKYSNTRLKTKPRVGDLRDGSGALISDGEAKAGLLNAFFASVFTREDLESIPTLPDQAVSSELSDVEITLGLVEEKLRSLKASSAPGPDELHPRVLKELHRSLAAPLAHLFRKSIDTGRIPQDWSLARVVPLHKKGDKQNPSNYRPVSLTAVPCKVMESLIRDQILNYLTEEDLLSCHQYGFRPKRSCTLQLLEVLDAWSRELESRNPIDVIYLDFQKAFDSVPHRRLLLKLQSYGITGKLLAWIEAFLTGRKQQVVLEGHHSDWSDVNSGVPQGSVLGPLLFLVYVNDLPGVVQSDVKLFADDTKLFTGVPSTADAERLQADLDALMRWSESWQMPFNQGKCKVLHIGRTNQEFQYMLDDSRICSSSLERDLGVHVDSELKFRKQASSAVAKATQILAVIRRSFARIDRTTLPLLFKVLVRPHLEYGNLVWGPYNRADQRLVEKVQRRATRLVECIRHKSYEERLRYLQLPSLYYRRRRGDMIYVYQLFHGGIDADPQKFFTLATGSTRGHPFKLLKPTASTRVRRLAFATRTVNDWNSLPAEVVCSPSLNVFKARLDEHWSSITYKIPVTD